jgi:hypothetical protein
MTGGDRLKDIRDLKARSVQMLAEMAARPDCSAQLRKAAVRAIETQLDAIRAIDDGLFLVEGSP